MTSSNDDTQLIKNGAHISHKKDGSYEPQNETVKQKHTIIFHYLCFLVMSPKKELAAILNINVQLLANGACVFH